MEKNNPFNRTITDEQLKNMTKDDMIFTIYHCQKVMWSDEYTKEDGRSVSFQLLRIFKRLTTHFDIDIEKLYEDLLVEEDYDRYVNENLKEVLNG